MKVPGEVELDLSLTSSPDSEPSVPSQLNNSAGFIVVSEDSLIIITSHMVLWYSQSSGAERNSGGRCAGIEDDFFFSFDFIRINNQLFE